MKQFFKKYSRQYSKHPKFNTFSLASQTIILKLEAEHFAWIAECEAIKRETEV
jgi:hypothetical protein